MLINKLNYFCSVTFVRKILDFYIQSSLHVGIAVFCLSYISLMELQLTPDNTLLACVFFGTVLGYNYLKYSKFCFQTSSLSIKLKGIFWISGCAAIGFIFYYLHLNFLKQLGLGIGGILSLIYPYLRRFGYLKILWVSGVVTYVTFFLPVINETQLQSSLCLIGCKRFCIGIVLLIPFEIYDYQYDRTTVKTLPSLLGIAKTKLIGYVILGFFWILNVWDKLPSISSPNTQKNSINELFISLLLVLSIVKVNLDRSKYFTTFWVESIPIIWVLGWLFLA